MSAVVAALEADWLEIARTARARRAVERWAREYPALRGLRSLDGLLARRRDTAAAQGVLAALAALAPGDELAARALLHALMPGLVRFAHLEGGGDMEALSDLVASAWLRIRTYPPTRRGSVAANVLWDARKDYRALGRVDAIVGIDDGLVVDRARDAREVRSAEDAALERVMLGEVMACRERGTVSEAQLALVVRTRVLGVPLREIADEEEVTPVVLQQRRWRAERALRGEVDYAG